MNLASELFPASWLWFSSALAMAVLGVAIGRVRWRDMKQAGRHNVWLGAVVALMVMWLISAGIRLGLNLHPLGAGVMTLMFGPALGLLAIAAALIGSALNGGVGWSALGLNLMVMGVLPVLVTQGLRVLVEKYLPANYFVYIFVLAFGGSGLGVMLLGGVATLLVWLSGAYSLDLLSYEYLPFFMLLTISEAWLSGMLMTLMVIYRPGWVDSFDDQRYLKPAPAPKRRSQRGKRETNVNE